VDLTLRLNDFQHTWIGDLSAMLIHEDTGTSVVLFDRIGRMGGTGFGDSSNFNGDYHFNDSFTGSLWGNAATLNSSGFIAPGQYFPTTTNGALSTLGDFYGEDSFGTWTLRITDSQSTDAGSLHCWGLQIVTTDLPAPGALAVLAFGGLCNRRRRRD
jgi:MYXO-CTERM domain-containing protein